MQRHQKVLERFENDFTQQLYNRFVPESIALKYTNSNLGRTRWNFLEFLSQTIDQMNLIKINYLKFPWPRRFDVRFLFYRHLVLMGENVIWFTLYLDKEINEQSFGFNYILFQDYPLENVYTCAIRFCKKTHIIAWRAVLFACLWINKFYNEIMDVI